MKIREVTVAVPEEHLADFYALVGTWLKRITAEEADATATIAAVPAETRAASTSEQPRARRASRYDAITTILQDHAEDEVELSFDELAEAIGQDLPSSARKHRAWWSNTEANSQGRAWASAGFATEDVDLEQERVTFRRT